MTSRAGFGDKTLGEVISRESRRADGANRSWNKNDDAGGDDVFYSEIVVELRSLKEQGLFESLHEHRSSRHGSTRIDRVDIRGSINYNFDRAEE